MVIAIDGPAGAGKSTVARRVAEALGFRYLDSGAMYRALALSLLERPGDAPTRASELSIELGEGVSVDGRDVTTAIRAPEVSELASRVATDKGVRAALAGKQREALTRGDWVAEGRDIGTVIAPDADLKVYLTASAEERARRRAGVVHGTPGVTRDRMEVEADWNGRRFVLVDTGGIDYADGDGIAGAVRAQARRAMDEAAAIVFVVDARAGIGPGDEEIAKELRRAPIPVIVVANKIDTAGSIPAAAELYRFGLGEPVPVSGTQGLGTGDLLDRVADSIADSPPGA